MTTLQRSMMFATLLSLASVSSAQVAEQSSLTMDGARKVIAAATAEASSRGAWSKPG